MPLISPLMSVPMCDASTHNTEVLPKDNNKTESLSPLEKYMQIRSKTKVSSMNYV